AKNMSFNANNQDFVEVAHTGAQALIAGTVAFTFTVDSLGGVQTLMSKDASGFEDGGHLTIEIDKNDRVVVRFQGENEDGDFKNLFLRSDEIEAGQSYSLAFTFSPEGTELYLNGELVDRDDGFADGISANGESLVLGASTTTRRSGELNNLKEFFDGEISDFVFLDRPLTAGEVLFLSEGALDIQMPRDVPANTSPGSALVIDEQLIGSALGESLRGGAGNDWLFGDDGNDTLTGGLGQDTFAFAPRHGNDVITDFDPTQDSIALRDGLQIENVRAIDGDGDGQIDDTLISFDPGDSVLLTDVLLAENELALI
ncbi:MAG: LamG-like jellyroll fold domain-containing protein, partial [Pseudomonadota bacterium]